LDENFELELWNTQVEMIVLGSLFARPEEAGFRFMNVIKNEDFHDPMTAYFHVFFNDYILTYSNEVTEAKCNMFASMDPVRFKGYKKFGYFKNIREMIGFATTSDDELKGQVDVLKKWSVLRQLHKNGYDVSKILGHPRFNSLSADACANWVRGNLDRICNKVITGLDDTLDLSENVTSLMDSFLEAPERGINCAWDFVNQMCSGIMEHDSYCIAMNSNQGKGRALIYLAMHIALVEGVNVAFFGNEMDFNSMQLAGLSVVNNAPAIQKLHGNEIHIPEKRFKTGAYFDSNNNIIYRKTDSEGNFIETIEQFRTRLEQTSREYRNVKNAIKWFEENKSKVWFKNCSANYSDDSLQRLVRQAIYQHNVGVWFYDTLKHGTGSDMSKWTDLVQTATHLCEMNATLPTASIMSAQLNNAAFQTKPEDMTSSTLASASYIYHLFDVMIVMQHLRPEVYNDYALQVINPATKKKSYKHLDPKFHLTAANLLKNRRGSKNIYLLNSNLDENTWIQQDGILVPKSVVEANLPWVD
jgi:replicative DNA helicase